VGVSNELRRRCASVFAAPAVAIALSHWIDQCYKHTAPGPDGPVPQTTAELGAGGVGMSWRWLVLPAGFCPEPRTADKKSINADEDVGISIRYPPRVAPTLF
jgi:hypothetical protein